MDRERKIHLETIDYLESYIFEGFISEITEVLQKTFTDKDDGEIRDLMEMWWGSLEIMHEDGDNDVPAKEGKKVKSDDIDDIKKVHQIIFNEIPHVGEDGIHYSAHLEEPFDWMWDGDWGQSPIGQDISFDDDDERGELLDYSLKLIFNPNITYIKGSL
jgi:hypothetical protein